MEINFEVKRFDELSLQELYEILQLRAAVFVVEQDCVYQDLDGKDYKAIHVIGKKGNKIIAYTRIFAAGLYFDNASIGRVVVADEMRKYGYGHNLMSESIKAVTKLFGTSKIEISAQVYLEKFYKNHKFIPIGEGYLEDGIPHIRMIRT